MSTDALIAKVRARILAQQLLPPGAPVLAAVSGGLDSMVLLHVLHMLGFSVQAAHVDHATRAGDSAKDAAFVAAHCAALGMHCAMGQWGDWSHVALSGASFEMEARARRYAFLTDAAQRAGCAFVATGHHRDDQAETVLLRLLRGAGPGGLAGIRASRTLAEGVTLVRPLLGCARAELENFAHAHAIPWREDASNATRDHVRNRVRHEVLPQLVQAFDSHVAARLAQTAEILHAEDDLLAALAADAAQAVVIDGRAARVPFLALHPALQRRVVLGWLQAHGIVLDFARVLAVVSFVAHAATGKRLSLNAEWLLHAAHEAVYLVHAGATPPAERVSLPLAGHAAFLGWQVDATAVTAPSPAEARAWCSPTRQVFDGDLLGNALALRTRMPGDFFQPLGQERPQKLQDYLVNRHVPQPDRDTVPLLLAGDTIAWVVGHAPGAQFAVSSATRRAVVVELTPCD